MQVTLETILDEIKSLGTEMNQRFTAMEKRFSHIDERLNNMDKSIEKRLFRLENGQKDMEDKLDLTNLKLEAYRTAITNDMVTKNELNVFAKHNKLEATLPTNKQHTA